MTLPRFPLRAPSLLAALLAVAFTPTLSHAQEAPRRPRDATLARLASPVPNRVYQRDRNGFAEFPVTLEEGPEDAKIVSVRLTGSLQAQPHAPGGFPGASPMARPGIPVEGARFDGDRLVNVPTGGPYVLTATIRGRNSQADLVVDNVFVGDLWVLAGQSNMEGYGDLVDVSPTHPLVMALGMDGHWTQAEEPLHWLVDSPDPVHSGDPATRGERSAEQHKKRPKGAGLGLPFAAELAQATGVPVGLIPCAHGGTSMAQWNPAKKHEAGDSLYGSMIRQVGLAGGKVKGVLWYQGESDANLEAVQVFRQTFVDFIGAVRSDLGQSDLPFYYVQIGRFIREGDPAPWNTVQNDQLKVAEAVPNTAVISVIDLELDDLIHVGTQGLKRVGRRLAKVALRELFGQVGATSPTFDRVIKGPGNTLIVKFKGVNLVEESTGPPGMPPGMPNPFLPRTARRLGGPPGMFPATGVVGLQPDQRIAGFSIRKEDGTKIPLIFQAAPGSSRDSVILKLVGPLPERAFLWHGHGLDPYCNLTDGEDMAIPVFGPVPLDALR